MQPVENGFANASRQAWMRGPYSAERRAMSMSRCGNEASRSDCTLLRLEKLFMGPSVRVATGAQWELFVCDEPSV